MMRYATLSAALIFVIAFTSLSVAQEGIGISKPLPASGKSFGIEFGVARNTQHGLFSCLCGTTYTSGSGNGYTGSLFYELPVEGDLFAGIKVGFDQKSTTSTQLTSENAIVGSPFATGAFQANISMDRIATVTLSFIRFEPFAQYQVLHTNFFVQLGAGVSVLVSSNLTQKRELISHSVTLSDGSTINNVTFTNGELSEDIAGSALPGINKFQFSGAAAAGYNFVMGAVALAPMVTYDFPFSNISSTNSNNWKIMSLYGSIQVGYGL